MITYNVELNHKENKDGNHLLILRLTKDRKHKRIALGRYIKKYHFNPDAKYGLWVRSSCLQHKEINEMIKSLISQYQAKETEFIKRGKQPNLIQVLTEKSPNARISFPEFAKKEVERHRSISKHYSESESIQDGLTYKSKNLDNLEDIQIFRVKEL